MIHIAYNVTLHALDINFPYDSRLVLMVKRIFSDRKFIGDESPKVWRVPVKAETKKQLEQFEKAIQIDLQDPSQEVRIDAAVYNALEAEAEYTQKNFDLADSIDYRDEAVEKALGGKLDAPGRVAAAYLARNARGVILNTLSDSREAWTSVLGYVDMLRNETPILVICKNADTWSWSMAIRNLTKKTVWVISDEGAFTKERNMYGHIKGEQQEVCVIDYASLPKYKTWLAGIAWKNCIIDEAQALAKSTQSQSWKIVYDLLTDIPRRVFISRIDLDAAPWLVYKLLLLARRTADFRMNEWDFQVRYCGAWEERGKKSLGEPRNIDELRRRLKELCWIDFQENPFATGEEVSQDIERGME